MLSNKSILLLILLIVASALSAWSITDSYFGNRYGSFDARSYAMGSAGTYNDMRAFGIADNPANLTLMRKRVGFSVNSYIDRNQQDRSFPLYNSFDNYIDDAVYASNINNYDDFAGAVYYAYRMNNLSFGLGAYYKPLLNFEGDYTEEIRNNRNTDNDLYPEKIAQNTIEGLGTLNQTGFAFSVGHELGDYTSINLGFDYSLLDGDITREKTIRWSDYSINAVHALGAYNLPELTEKDDYNLNGEQMKIGLAMQVTPRFGFAATYIPKTTLVRKGNYYFMRDAYRNTAMDSLNVDFEEDYIMPTELRFGIVYKPRNVMRTVFNMDIEYVMQSEIDERYSDTVNFYAGVEHHITNRIPFRIGFQAVNSWFFNTEMADTLVVYHAKKVLTPMFTAGSSIEIHKNLTLDLGFGYTWREYEAVDMFGDAYYNDKTYTGASSYALWPNSHISLQNRGWENPDKIRENNVSLNAGLSFTW
ncbi:MAG: hypothetical protein RBS43_03425 [Candidatus Cloacimonas sp.]|jgi:hypothetical protein|nr:hypothetical protein [Candidatus Cloacimonas sp.]